MLILVSAFLAKAIVANRAVVFIHECMTQDEMEFILDESVVPIEKVRQYELTKRALGCVGSKQTAVERLVTNVLGADLFPKTGAK
jgi:hypothetical protein